MSNEDISNENATDSVSSGQWFILALLVLLNAIVIGLLIMALTGRLAL